MTRTGKIARLPHEIREQVNLRIQNGETAQAICVWLNSLPEIGPMLAAEFHSEPVNEVNISNWKLGGFREWEARQEALEAVQRFATDAADLGKAARGRLGDKMAVSLMAQIARTLQMPPSEGVPAEEQLQRLHDLRSDIVALRRGDHSAQWIELERKKTALELRKYKEAAAERKRKAQEAINPPKKKAISRETLDQIKAELDLL